jgi:hypothetical protein
VIVGILEGTGLAILALAEAFGWELGWWNLMPTVSVILGAVLGVEWVVPSRAARRSPE